MACLIIHLVQACIKVMTLLMQPMSFVYLLTSKLKTYGMYSYSATQAYICM